MAKSFQVKLVRSTIGCTQKQKDVARCLGLRKTNSSAVVADNPAMRGQIRTIQHLLKVTPVK